MKKKHDYQSKTFRDYERWISTNFRIRKHEITFRTPQQYKNLKSKPFDRKTYALRVLTSNVEDGDRYIVIVKNRGRAGNPRSAAAALNPPGPLSCSVGIRRSWSFLARTDAGRGQKEEGFLPREGPIPFTDRRIPTRTRR